MMGERPGVVLHASAIVVRSIVVDMAQRGTWAPSGARSRLHRTPGRCQPPASRGILRGKGKRIQFFNVCRSGLRGEEKRDSVAGEADNEEGAGWGSI